MILTICNCLQQKVFYNKYVRLEVYGVIFSYDTEGVFNSQKKTLNKPSFKNNFSVGKKYHFSGYKVAKYSPFLTKELARFCNKKYSTQ